MPVYVDWLMRHGWRMRGKTVTSCHLTADSPEELDAFAQGIGLKREWRHRNHYDLTAGMRKRAVASGAEELTKEEIRNRRTGCRRRSTG